MGVGSPPRGQSRQHHKTAPTRPPDLQNHSLHPAPAPNCAPRTTRPYARHRPTSGHPSRQQPLTTELRGPRNAPRASAPVPLPASYSARGRQPTPTRGRAAPSPPGPDCAPAAHTRSADARNRRPATSKPTLPGRATAPHRAIGPANRPTSAPPNRALQRQPAAASRPKRA